MDIKQAIDKSLFIFGAGASYDAGCKMSGDMLKALTEIICLNQEDPFTEIERETIKFLLTCLNYHSEWKTWEVNREYSLQPNIEELALLIRRIKNRDNFLPYPVTGNWADKLLRLEAQFKEQNKFGLYHKIEDTIKNKLIPQWLEVKQTDFLKPLDDFFQRNTDKRITFDIFSMNYDKVIEQHFSEQKAKPYRGFYSGEWRGFNVSDSIDEFNIINLYKLHGSLDWTRLIDGTVLEKSDIDEYYEDIEGENRIEHDPVIIFGHGTKFFSVEPFFSLIQNFSNKLKERNYFFIIGYSFFDPYINNLLIQAVKDGGYKNKKIIIVNPSFAFNPPLKVDHFIDHDLYGCHLNENNSEAKKILTNYIEDIQRNAFYSELPEFNIKQVPSEALYYLRMGTKEFFNRFFNNSGEAFLKLIEDFESQGEKSLPF
ncbi:SIR2 family protein [Adhaeribacter pallidiroseus]|nr:SIR2 family protein [Adhaeribacter pallidiroseus]